MKITSLMRNQPTDASKSVEEHENLTGPYPVTPATRHPQHLNTKPQRVITTLRLPIRTSMESTRANRWSNQGVLTSCSGGSGCFYRQHDIGDDEGTAKCRMVRRHVTDVQRAIFNDCERFLRVASL
ncbi:hypothetical protein BD410DRAFT_445762 [Rickenella mellea]|uniref:Uncharacterized protein n=1 Tax=Rickenella mellea TaxID=50990 RepID=A0A4Y7PWQ3_9AGAM|nr:hypothetical protein BD410DRAFT_445762 [Rickenella mellea]